MVSHARFEYASSNVFGQKVGLIWIFSLLFSFEIIEIVRGWYNQDCRCFEELHTTDV